MIYVWHHAITLTLAAGATYGLTRGRWTHRCPQLAVLLWQATTFSALTATVGLLLSTGLAPYNRGIIPSLLELIANLTAGAPRPLTAAHVAAVVAGLLIIATVVAVQVRSSWQLWQRRSRHHLLLRLVARADTHNRVLVLEHPAAAAYYLPGPSGCVVVSTGTLNALTESELAAVLAHEHAHARQRHHLVLAPFHALRQALPWRPVLRAAACVELLVEMCADDHAARHHGAVAIAAALHRFRELGSHPAPPGTLAAADQAVMLRIERLRSAQPPLAFTIRWTVALAALATATTPISLFVLPI